MRWEGPSAASSRGTPYAPPLAADKGLSPVCRLLRFTLRLQNTPWSPSAWGRVGIPPTRLLSVRVVAARG